MAIKKQKPGSRKKLQAAPSKGRKNLQTKATITKKKPAAKGKPGPNATKKVPVGFDLLKRDEKLLVKHYAFLDKSYNTLGDAINKYCYDSDDKPAAAVVTNKAITAVSKALAELKRSVLATKQGLKPRYK